MLPEHVVEWVIHSAQQMSKVESVYRLHGGMSSKVFGLTLMKNNQVQEYVLRLFDNAKWIQDEPDLALHEAASLRFASQIGVKTPRLIAFDQTGKDCGVPAVLMTKLEGEVILKPQNRGNWLNQIAQSLVQIHKQEANEFAWTYYTYQNIGSFEIPSWSDVQDLWKRAVDIVRGQQPNSEVCFIHRDYHPTNILWSKDAVSGVVDWVNACKGPAGIDIGHCRVNLAMLFDVQTADEFLTAYLHNAGTTFFYDPYWDILSLVDTLFGPPQVYPGWTALGFTGLTDQMMKELLDRYLVSLMKWY